MGIKNQQFGQWKTKKQLGQGGNGEVWLVLNSSSEKAAIKLLTRIEGSKGYKRFKNEVKIIKESSEIDGVLPIVDSFLPDEIGEENPWYVMPLGIPLTKYSREEGFNFETAVQVVIEVGKTLIELHQRGINHRDIKPENILIMGGKSFLSDFGLVDFPDKHDLTDTGERIGARWTIAPEMERDSQNADGKSADVYSLAKTLWILITGRKNGFEGQYDPDSINGLRHLKLIEPEGEGFFFTNPPLVYIGLLDNLLQDSTDHDPLQRPNMSQFIERIQLWIQVYKDFSKRNPLQWQDVQKNLFPRILPQRAFWHDPEDIIGILNLLASSDNLNHTLLPDGGGMDLLGAQFGHEEDTIELIVDEKVAYIVKPKSLIFESFSFDTEWNYFRLETGNLDPTGLTFLHHNHETLRELNPLNYIDEAEWQYNSDNYKIYPTETRLICRYVQGDFLILQKTAPYNRSGYTYDGKHNRMNSDEFRHYIAEKIELVKELLADQPFLEKVAEKGFDTMEAILLYLDETYRLEYLAQRSEREI